MIEFGIFDHLERQHAIPLAQQFSERLDLLDLADWLGFWGYHLAEHHQSPLSVAPSQNVFLAAAAQRTTRLALVPLVYCLPLYHPLRLIEEIAMLDSLSDGRLQIGVGRAISYLEHRFFGNDPDEAGERFREELAILVEGLTRDRLTYHGRFHDFDDVPMVLRPTQQPYPPIWYPGNVEFAAANGFHFLGGGPIRSLPGLAAKYRDGWLGHRDDLGRLNPHVSEPKVGTVRVVFVADSDDEAHAIATRAFRVRAANWPKPGYATDGVEAGSGEAANTRIHPSFGGDAQFAMKVEALIAGSPATVKQYVERYAAESGMNYFVGAFQWGDLTHAEAAHSLELFAQAVIPAAA
ncbi:MAG: LLM class flavin-dependent oxidoreductase [Chloroflexi bacterium]|nr:LLM class flavin-dependent oxidoreductase [Chloroflexota bacterium]MDA1001975.1 LLM class flavin-dependent oxidoreductase [Chloroflexota bacterium]